MGALLVLAGLLAAAASTAWAASGDVSAPAPVFELDGREAAKVAGGAPAQQAAEAAKARPLRGVGIYGANMPNELQVFAQAGLRWFYTWTTYSDPGTLNVARMTGIEYVPMIWGLTQLAEVPPQIKNQTYVPGSFFPANTKFLLGFNEPNKAEQADLTSQQAATLWPQVVAIAKNLNLKLGSPAPAHCGQPDCLNPKQAPFDWLDDFFNNCTAMYGAPCKADIIAVHYYGCTVADLQRFMVQVAQKYNRPIWLTELACPQAGKPAAALAEMRALLTMLDQQPRVARYSWFAAHTQGTFLGPSASLMQNSYSFARLTNLGRLFASFGSTSGISSGAAPAEDLRSEQLAAVQAEVCPMCADAAANASVVVPNVALRGVCEAQCGARY